MLRGCKATFMNYIMSILELNLSRLVLSAGAHCDGDSQLSSIESPIWYSPFCRTNPNFRWKRKARISTYSTGVFCWKFVCLCLCLSGCMSEWFHGHDFKSTTANNGRRDTRKTSKWPQLKFIKESYVRTEELCWWHPHFQTLECHLHLPARGLKCKKNTRKPQFTDAGVKLHKRRGLTANSFSDFTCTFFIVGTQPFNQNRWHHRFKPREQRMECPQITCLFSDDRHPHFTLRRLRVALVKGYSCVHQNNIATNLHATSIARTSNNAGAHHQTLQSN